MSTLLIRNIQTSHHAECRSAADRRRRDLRRATTSIEYVGPTADLPPDRAAAADRVIDARDMIIMPGLVNTHHHLYQTLTRCIAVDSVLFNWLKTLYPIWARMDGEAVYISALTGMAELILSGCTTSSDHLYLFPNGAKLDDEIRAALEIGLRFHAARGSMSLGESKGGLPPDSVVEDEASDPERLRARDRDVPRSEAGRDDPRGRCAVLAVLGDAEPDARGGGAGAAIQGTITHTSGRDLRRR